MINGNKIKEVILEGSKKLGKCCEEPLREARILMRECLQADDAELMLRMEAPCQQRVREQYSEMIERRAKGEPVAYVTGHKEFMKLDFKVEPGVLIPRPDTETLCEWVLEQAPPKAKLLDVFTGSGCIGISIAHELEQVKVTCVDVSEQALNVTKQNSERLGVQKRVETVQADLRKSWPFPENSFHVVTANPPYIPSGDIETLDIDVKEFEPRLALDGGTDGLEFYEIIAKNAARVLKSKGLLAVEIGIGQGEDVMRIMSKYLVSVSVLEDLQGIGRVVVGYKQKPDYAGHRGRVRDRAITLGMEHFQDYELLEMLLFYIIPQKDTKAKAKSLLREFGTISEILDLPPDELMIAGGLTANGAMLFSLVRHLMQRYSREKWAKRPILKDFMDMGRYAVDWVPNDKVESFYVICLSTQRQVLKMKKIAEGTVNEVQVYVRKICELVFRTGAKSIVLAHNHPSGNINPSEGDIEVTREVVKAVEPMGVDVVDYIIVGGNGNFLSMEQEGFIKL